MCLGRAGESESVRTRTTRTVVFHVQRCWCVVVVYSVAVVQESTNGLAYFKHFTSTPNNETCTRIRNEAGITAPAMRAPRAIHGPTLKLKGATHRMLLTSLPTFVAYAPWSLLSFVFRLILKNTSSPVCVVTCTTHSHYTSLARAEDLGHRDRDGQTLMLIGAFASSALGWTSSCGMVVGRSPSDIVQVSENRGGGGKDQEYCGW